MQLVMFPPIELPKDIDYNNITTNRSKSGRRPSRVKVNSYHVAMEVWIEPKLGKCVCERDVKCDEKVK